METELRPGVSTSAVADVPALGREEWRRNLVITLFACLLGSGGMSLANPFIPLFMAHELAITDASELALWTGIVVSANGLTIIFASPFWGQVADRHGRKPMLIRALAGSGVFVALLAVTQAPWQLAVARLGLGAVTGVNPMASAMIAAQAPRHQVGWALGVVASGFAIGGAVGPLAGALVVPFLGLRGAFVFAGILMAAGGVLVALGIRECREDANIRRPDVFHELRAVDRPTLKAIAVLIAAQCFLWMFLQSAQPMIALRILELAPAAAATVTGVVFGLMGATTAVGALSQSRFARRTAYRPVALVAAALATGTTVVAATTATIPILVILIAVLGLATGMLLPTMSSLLGLQTPARLVGTVFGLGNSAQALGFTVGPFVTGVVAAGYGASVGLVITVVALIAMACVLAFVREPAP